MNERSLRVLEFTKIRAQLAQYCVSDMGRALCDALTPSNRLEDVLRMQQETEEAHSLLSYLGGTPMLSFSDVRASLHLAQIGSSLSPRALMEIGASLRAARAAREAIVTDRQDTPLMSANASRLSTFKDIEQAISDAIISEDEIADRASNELFQIRRKMRACNERVRERLNGMIHNPNFQKYLQDAIITMRADRYVLPVRQEYRAMVPGIVHDQSSTGRDGVHRADVRRRNRQRAEAVDFGRKSGNREDFSGHFPRKSRRKRTPSRIIWRSSLSWILRLPKRRWPSR